MRPLSQNDIESEISYAYLHAVVSHTGASCSPPTRALDGNGIDATITGWGPFPNGGYRQEVDIKVQLKATSIQPVLNNGYFSYHLKGIQRYNDLRSEAISTQRILIVLFLPEHPKDWLSITEDEMMLKRCAYWVSLRGAPVSSNHTGQTIYIPQTQIFDTNNLKTIFAGLSRNEVFNYQIP